MCCDAAHASQCVCVCCHCASAVARVGRLVDVSAPVCRASGRAVSAAGPCNDPLALVLGAAARRAARPAVRLRRGAGAHGGVRQRCEHYGRRPAGRAPTQPHQVGDGRVRLVVRREYQLGHAPFLILACRPSSMVALMFTSQSALLGLRRDLLWY